MVAPTPPPVARVELVDRVVDAGRRAPSAGFSQGWAFLVLEGPRADRAVLGADRAATVLVAAGSDRWDRLRDAPVVIVPLAHRQAYLDRYGEPDKAGLGLDRAEAWRVPFWLVDTAFATMAMLLAATDAGLGALFFGLGGGETRPARSPGRAPRLRADRGHRPRLAGHHDPRRRRSPGRRPWTETVHYGGWSAPPLDARPARTPHHGLASRPVPPAVTRPV